MQNQSSSKLQLTLGTGAFAFCFAVFGSMSAMMPIISKQMHLSPVQKSIAVALPVLLGCLGRIPLGMLTDRFGGRIVFSFVMLVSIIPAFLMGTALRLRTAARSMDSSLEIALASFSVGVGFVSGWYQRRSGKDSRWAVYGAGNIGQSLGCLWLARHRRGDRIPVGILDLRRSALDLAAASSSLLARDAPRRGAIKSFRDTCVH